jgi:hypothetical protein
LDLALCPLTGLGLGADGGGGDVDPPRSVPLCLLSNLRACLQAPGFFAPCLRACLQAPGLRTRAFFALRCLACLQAPGLRTRAFFALRCLAGLQSPGFFSPLALAEFFLAAFDHSPLDFAAVITGQVGFIADAFRPGHALLGPHRRKGRLPSFRGEHLGGV